MKMESRVSSHTLLACTGTKLSQMEILMILGGVVVLIKNVNYFLNIYICYETIRPIRSQQFGLADRKRKREREILLLLLAACLLPEREEEVEKGFFQATVEVLLWGCARLRSGLRMR